MKRILFLFALVCSACPGDYAQEDAGVCDNDVNVAIFVHSFDRDGSELGCDPQVQSSDLTLVGCQDEPGAFGAWAFRTTHRGYAPFTVRFEGYPGFHTILVSKWECENQTAWRSVSVVR